MSVNTQGYGGNSISKGVSVYTNDPNQKQFGLNIVIYRVERFVSISERKVRLIGVKGKTVSAETRIQPAAEYPFTITGISAEKGNNILYRLDKQASGYLLTVESRPEAAGIFSDRIRLKTDNPRLHEIEISVYGNLKVPHP
ncbi:MAG: hypothetical protein AB7S75_20215 [Desulfococcaceae bacterium]